MSGMVKCVVDGCDKELRKDTLCNHYMSVHREWIFENTIGLINRNGRLVINNIPNYRAFKSSLEGNPLPLTIEYKSSEGDEDLFIDCASKVGYVKRDTAIKHISSMPEKHTKAWLNTIIEHFNNKPEALYKFLSYIEQKPQEKIMDAEVNAKLIKERDDALAKAKEATDDAQRFRDIAAEAREESFIDKYNDAKSKVDTLEYENKQQQSQINNYKKSIEELKKKMEETQENKLKANLSQEVDDLDYYEKKMKQADDIIKKLKKEHTDEIKKLKKKHKSKVKAMKKIDSDSDSDSE